MGKINKILLLSAVFATSTALARTDVQGALQQLKTNENNAKANQKQYEENADIASKNIVEVTQAIKHLRDQKGKLNANSTNLNKNKAILDAMKTKLQQFKNQETAQMAKETAQINQLKAVLEKLEANRMKREQNVKAYDDKIAEVEKERGEWNQQKEAFAAIQKELESKEKRAIAEREKWLNKRKGYRAEANKWGKEAQVAEQNRVKFDKLKD